MASKPDKDRAAASALTKLASAVADIALALAEQANDLSGLYEGHGQALTRMLDMARAIEQHARLTGELADRARGLERRVTVLERGDRLTELEARVMSLEHSLEQALADPAAKGTVCAACRCPVEPITAALGDITGWQHARPWCAEVCPGLGSPVRPVAASADPWAVE
jgi:hypothetical protein